MQPEPPIDGATVHIVLPPDVATAGRTITWPAGHPIEIVAVGEPAGGFIPLTVTIPVLAINVSIGTVPPDRGDREQTVARLLGRAGNTDPRTNL